MNNGNMAAANGEPSITQAANELLQALDDLDEARAHTVECASILEKARQREADVELKIRDISRYLSETVDDLRARALGEPSPEAARTIAGVR